MISAPSAVVADTVTFTKSVLDSVFETSVISHVSPSNVIVEPALAKSEADYCITPLIETVLRLEKPTISVICPFSFRAYAVSTVSEKSKLFTVTPADSPLILVTIPNFVLAILLNPYFYCFLFILFIVNLY